MSNQHPRERLSPNYDHANDCPMGARASQSGKNMRDAKGFKTKEAWAMELGDGVIAFGHEKGQGAETTERISPTFYGKITLSFENGKLTMINKSENIKPGGAK